MKQKLRHILTESAKVWVPLPPFEIERPKVKEHGELSTNLAMLIARRDRLNPNEVAKKMVASLADTEGIVQSVTVAGAGFLNFVIKKEVWQKSLKEMVERGESFGRSKEGKGEKVIVEFVSANPTGPLHIGNARGGPLGDVIAALLEATGYEVSREYYVNDVGGQIEKLGRALLDSLSATSSQNAEMFLVSEPDRKLVGGSAALGRLLKVPSREGDYSGDYISDLAQAALEKFGETILKKGEKEAALELGSFGVGRLLEEIRMDCDKMGIRFNRWFFEGSLAASAPSVLRSLDAKNLTRLSDGALWFAPRDEFLSDRECVLRKSDGRLTYFANDIAYHVDKLKRGFDRLIDVWGSNHHGHVPRVKAALSGLGYDPEKLEVVLYQYVRVKRGAETVKMSKRGGNFVTAREVLDEVGRDAFRFSLLMRAADSHLDFDLELACRQSQENPVYYIQYAHARLASIFRKAIELKIPSPSSDTVNPGLLSLPEEIEMIRLIHEYPEEVSRAAAQREPHRIPFYLLELARAFQSYYTKAKEDPRYRVLSGDVDTSQAKMYLCRALKLVFSQGLKLIGVSAPEEMRQE